MAKVLVAEDEPALAELVRANLEGLGHEVTVAEDGRFVLKQLMDNGPFDVVVLDLMMPWADGFDVLKNLGEAKPHVIVLTARDDDYTRKRAADLGIDAYLTKPYDPDELAAKIDEVTA